MIAWLEPAADRRLDAIVQAIVDDAAPRRIILFGSRARGENGIESDYDLAVELAYDPANRAGLVRRLRTAVAAAAPDARVDLVLRRPGELDARGDDPGYMDWDIVRDGVLLFASDPSNFPDVRSRVRPVRDGSVREVPPHKSVADWVARAEQDRRAAENILAAGAEASWMALGFHAQQLAEKYLKILLVEGSERPPRTHDTVELLVRARKVGHPLDQVDDACAMLREFAVAVRYPDEAPIPSESTARHAWAAAQRVVEAVERERR